MKRNRSIGKSGARGLPISEQQVWSGFEHLPYVACTRCKEYTRRGNSGALRWVEEHGPCGGFQFFAVRPPTEDGYVPCINLLEELAALSRKARR